QTNPNQSSNTNNQDSNPPPQIIFLEVNLTQANANDEGKAPDINWSYIVKHRNEPLPPPSKAKKLEGITSHSNNNRIISFDIHSKFTYPTEETTDYLKEHHQLIIFAHKESSNNTKPPESTEKPSYKTNFGIPYATLYILNKALLHISYTHITTILKEKEYNMDFAITNNIMDYLINHFDDDTALYEIECIKDNDDKLTHIQITNKASNKTFEIHKQSKNTDEERQQAQSNTQTITTTTQSNQTTTPQNNNTTQTNTAYKLYINDEYQFDTLRAVLGLNIIDKLEVYISLQYKITLDMLREVFEITEKTKDYGNKERILKEMEQELNRLVENTSNNPNNAHNSSNANNPTQPNNIHTTTNNTTPLFKQPKYVTYKLNTRERLEHFFAQCVAEVGEDFKLGENLNYSAAILIKKFRYYKATFKENLNPYSIEVTSNKDRIKEALSDGRVTKIADYNVRDILSKNGDTTADNAIKLLIQEDYINDWLDTTNSAISQVANITEIIKNMTDTEKTNKTTKKPFTDDELKNLIKDYTPIELIESIAFYRKDVVNIKLAFAHGKVSVDKGKQYEIPFSSESNKAFTIITQAVFNKIVSDRKDKTPNQIEIGNKVYARDGKGNNNAPYNANLKGQIQDGYKYKGKGLIHLTFKNNYILASNIAKTNNWVSESNYFVKNPNIIRNNGKYALMSAACFWSNETHKQSGNNHYNANFQNKHCYDIADSKIGTDDDRVNAITYVVNRHTDSYKKRRDIYQRIKKDNIFKDFPSKINHKL
ncbi:hypothetical protein CQA53_09740, partial [Helicobacter didelphidarum]